MAQAQRRVLQIQAHQAVKVLQQVQDLAQVLELQEVRVTQDLNRPLVPPELIPALPTAQIEIAEMMAVVGAAEPVVAV